MKGTARALSVLLAVVGLVLFFTDSIDLPWWAWLVFGSPLGFLVLLDDDFGDSFFGFLDGSGGNGHGHSGHGGHGGNGGNGGGDGGGGGNGGG